MEFKLKAERRDGVGKGVARKLRAAGKVPAVLYGGDLEPQHLVVDGLELWHALHTDAGANVLIDLKVDGDSFLTMPREVQRDHLKGTLIHVDLLRIRRDVAIEVDVPIHLVGESHGVKEGGVVEHHLWSLRIQCLPTQVPESIEADISRLGINEALHVADIKIPGNVTVLTPLEETVVSVVPPPVMELPEEVAAEELAELEEAEAEAAAEAEAEGEEEGAAPRYLAPGAPVPEEGQGGGEEPQEEQGEG
jgi:large subunit ribosomal protein L25